MLEENQALLFTREEVEKHIKDATKEIEGWKKNKEEWEYVLKILSKNNQ